MYEAKVRNDKGEILNLTGSPAYDVEISGLNPTVANIVTAGTANNNGEFFKSSKKQKKNIVITVYIKEPIEKNRVNLYKYFNTGNEVRLYFRNNSRNVYIDGYVEAFDLNHFSARQTAQISIICPQPNFIDVVENERINSNVDGRFYFPLSTKTLRAEGINALNFKSSGKGVVDFYANPPNAQEGIPTPENPIELDGIGNDFSIRLSLNKDMVDIPLKPYEEGMNYIEGGLTLDSPKNYLVTYVFVDHRLRILTDENNNKLYE